MADKKITALTATTAGLVADLAHIVTDVATNPTNKKITLLNFFNKVPTFLGFAGTGIQAYTSATSAVVQSSDTTSAHEAHRASTGITAHTISKGETYATSCISACASSKGAK